MENTQQSNSRGCGEYVFEVAGPLFCPYHNVWGRDVYTVADAFDHNPFTIICSSTSGSPVLLDAEGRFFGFLNDQSIHGARFVYDGASTLTVHVPEGQSLWVDESGAKDSWRRYNREVLPTLEPRSEIQDFWCDIEYCSWVEQKMVALEQGCEIQEVLTHDFILSYIRQVNELGYPKGKMTIDWGWQTGHETCGDWDVHTGRFPDLERTIGCIQDSGFVPGLWMAPVWIHPASRAAARFPEWVGPQIYPATPDAPRTEEWSYLQVCEGVQGHYEEVFARFYQMGVKKFKFDMIYAEKDYMKDLQRIFYRAAKNVSETIEIEIHQPDIFFTPFCDAVRTNDVLCNETFPWWRELTQVHMDVCRKSAPGRVINLDHIGGNDPAISGETFIEHLEFYKGATGYPAVSLLPKRLGNKAVDQLGRYLNEYTQTRDAVSQYC
jgi:hypothetical protein